MSHQMPVFVVTIYLSGDVGKVRSCSDLAPLLLADKVVLQNFNYARIVWLSLSLSLSLSVCVCVCVCVCLFRYFAFSESRDSSVFFHVT